jgi:hypothetical protein
MKQKYEMFKYKYETVLVAQYINPSEIDIRNRFDHLPKWLEEYIDNNMILNQKAGLNPTVLCSSYKDKIENIAGKVKISFGYKKHILRQDDWIVRTIKDSKTFCYSNDLFKWFYEKDAVMYS